MSVKNNDITFMICGPLHETSISALSYYKEKFNNVIYSTWKPQSNQEELLLTLVKGHLDNKNIIISEYMDVDNYDNTQNIYYQVWSWNQACLNNNTSYCIKSRSNCKYENIDPYIETCLSHPNKIVCISAFFRPCTGGHYFNSPSDFMIGMKTTEALNLTSQLINNLQKCIRLKTSAERKICEALYQIRHINININDFSNPQKTKSLMKENYIIVDVNKLQPTLRWHGRHVTTVFNHLHDISITDINNV